MNKQEIINKLNSFPYSKDEYWVITGSAMVLYGIREKTHDIDIGCSSLMADQLEKDGLFLLLPKAETENSALERT